MAIEKSPNILPILGKKIVPSLPKIAKMAINRYIWSHWLWIKKLKLSHARGNVFKIYRKYLNTVGIRIPNVFGNQMDESGLCMGFQLALKNQMFLVIKWMKVDWVWVFKWHSKTKCFCLVLEWYLTKWLQFGQKLFKIWHSKTFRIQMDSEFKWSVLGPPF